MSILRLLDGNGYIDSGEILFNGQDLTKISINDMYKIRGNEISVIFQEPMTSLNPVFTIERQISETFMVHQNMTKKQAAKEAVKMLADVQIPNPEDVVKQYPPSALRWNASARHDSNGPCMQTKPVDC
jgi:peptide/nickel transport system ATP-binding protein